MTSSIAPKHVSSGSWGKGAVRPHEANIGFNASFMYPLPPAAYVSNQTAKSPVHDAKPAVMSSTFASVRRSKKVAHAADAHAPVTGVRSSHEPHALSESRAAIAPRHESRPRAGRKVP